MNDHEITEKQLQSELHVLRSVAPHTFPIGASYNVNFAPAKTSWVVGQLSLMVES